MKVEIFIIIAFLTFSCCSQEVLNEFDDDSEEVDDKRAPIFWPSRHWYPRRPQRRYYPNIVTDLMARLKEMDEEDKSTQKRDIPILRFGKRGPTLLRFGRGYLDAMDEADDNKRASATLLRFGKRPDVILRFGRNF